MAPEDKIPKKLSWWRRLIKNLKSHATVVRNEYDPDFKEKMKWGIKFKWRW